MSKHQKVKRVMSITDFFVSKKYKTVTKITVNDKDLNESNATKDKAINDTTTNDKDNDYKDFGGKYGFDKDKWINGLTGEQKQLLELEIKYLHITWLTFLHEELTKPYFLKLKTFLKSQQNKTIFPPPNQIYSWSHYTPLPEIKCLILGQDPYHNYNQAHGLAFSVLEPTRPPPSLKNIYKAIQNDYPKFKVPSPPTGGGNLTKWAQSGVLMLNTCLTVEAHKANSHAKQGWEIFTHKAIETAIKYHLENAIDGKHGFVVMAWGMPAQTTLAKFTNLNKDQFLVLKTFHPSPFSAAKGFFTLGCFKKCNQWLLDNEKTPINWSLDDDSIFP